MSSIYTMYRVYNYTLTNICLINHCRCTHSLYAYSSTYVAIYVTNQSSDVTRLHTVAATRNSTPLNDEVPTPPGSPTLSRSADALPNVASSGGGRSNSNATAREAPFDCGNESSGEYCEKDVNERSSNPVLLLMGDLVAILQEWSKLQNTVARLKSNAATSVPTYVSCLHQTCCVFSTPIIFSRIKEKAWSASEML